MRLVPVVLFISSITLASACGSKSTAPEPPMSEPAGTPTAEPASAETDLLAMCGEMFSRQRECADTFLPALVNLRVTHDVPAGIAAHDAEIGREALLQKARDEYAVDSTDTAIADTCEKLAATIPPDQVDAMIPKVNECLATSSCDEFVPCNLEIQEAQLLKQ